LLRVWEQSGQGGPLTITLPPGFRATSAIPVNLRGEATGTPLAITGDELTVTLGAYQPASLVISRSISPQSFEDWQSLHFGNSGDPRAGADLDPDGDGTSNMNEVLAGTDPLDAGSAMRVLSLERESASATIRWSSVPGKVYQVEWCESLDGPWAESLPGSRVLAEGEVTTFNDPTIGGINRRFYRVRPVTP
jgi:hypothetical protein